MAKDRDIPQEICGYNILHILGEGGMSIVYAALQEHPKRTVALKVLRGGMYSPTASKRFHQEVEILGQLDHPWIAKIYDAGAHDDGNGLTPFYVMEYIEGGKELSDYLDEHELSERELLKLFTMITSAVEHGHHKGIVHRDLKPGNILINQQGEPKIIDFGVARSLNKEGVSEEAMTEAGRLVGTVQFMAPEQVDSAIMDIDARCDVYALGTVLFLLLTGRLPRTLEGLPIYEAVRQICEEQPVHPTVYNSDISKDLEAIILKAIASNREDRYQTAGALGRDMLRYLGHKPVKARRATFVDRFRLFTARNKRKIAVWTLATASLTLIGIVGYTLRMQSLSNISELEAEVQELKNQQTQHTPPNEDVVEILNVTPIPILAFDEAPRTLIAPQSGTVVYGILEDSYAAYTLNGEDVSLPPIGIEPSEATLTTTPDGNICAVIGRKQCWVIDAEEATTTRLRHVECQVLAVSQTDTWVALTGDDLSIQLIAMDGEVARYLSTSGEYHAVQLNGDGSRVAAATMRGVTIWETDSFPNIRVHAPFEQPTVKPIAIEFVGKHVVCCFENGSLCLVDINAQTHTVVSMGSFSIIESVAINRNLETVAFIADGSPMIFDVLTRTLQTLESPPTQLIGIEVLNSGSVLLFGSDGVVYTTQY